MIDFKSLRDDAKGAGMHRAESLVFGRLRTARPRVFAAGNISRTLTIFKGKHNALILSV